MFKVFTLISRCVLLCALLVAGCSQPPAPAPAAPPYNTTLTMKQLMEYVIDPAVDEVWDSVAIIITEKGENHLVKHRIFQRSAHGRL